MLAMWGMWQCGGLLPADVCTCCVFFLLIFCAGVIQEQLVESQRVHHQMEEELSKVKQVRLTCYISFNLRTKQWSKTTHQHIIHSIGVQYVCSLTFYSERVCVYVGKILLKEGFFQNRSAKVAQQSLSLYIYIMYNTTYFQIEGIEGRWLFYFWMLMYIFLGIPQEWRLWWVQCVILCSSLCFFVVIHG